MWCGGMGWWFGGIFLKKQLFYDYIFHDITVIVYPHILIYSLTL